MFFVLQGVFPRLLLLSSFGDYINRNPEIIIENQTITKSRQTNHYIANVLFYNFSLQTPILMIFSYTNYMVVEKCSFAYCTTSDYSGAIFFSNNCGELFVVNSCGYKCINIYSYQFAYVNVNYGKGVFIGTSILECSKSLTYSSLTNSLCCNYGSITMNNMNVSQNHMNHNAFCQVSSCFINLTYCTIENCKAYGSYIGYFSSLSPSSIFSFNNFIKNVETNYGIVYIASSSITIRYIIFSENAGKLVSSTQSITVRDCFIFINSQLFSGSITSLSISVLSNSTAYSVYKFSTIFCNGEETNLICEPTNTCDPLSSSDLSLNKLLDNIVIPIYVLFCYE